MRLWWSTITTYWNWSATSLWISWGSSNNTRTDSSMRSITKYKISESINSSLNPTFPPANPIFWQGEFRRINTFTNNWITLKTNKRKTSSKPHTFQNYKDKMKYKEDRDKINCRTYLTSKESKSSANSYTKRLNSSWWGLSIKGVLNSMLNKCRTEYNPKTWMNSNVPTSVSSGTKMFNNNDLKLKKKLSKIRG